MQSSSLRCKSNDLLGALPDNDIAEQEYIYFSRPDSGMSLFRCDMKLPNCIGRKLQVVDRTFFYIVYS